MLTVSSILSSLNEWAPPALAWEKDNIGLLVGSPSAIVSAVLICLDITPEVVCEAQDRGAELIIAHHPVIFHPLKSLNTSTARGELLQSLLKNDIAVIAMHTNADAARRGLNAALATMLKLQGSVPLVAAAELSDSSGFGIGAVGDLPESVAAADLIQIIKETFGCSSLRCSPFEPEKQLRRIAVSSGSGGNYIDQALHAGAQLYVTGDLTHHEFLDYGRDMVLVDAGHYETERVFIDLCRGHLENAMFEGNEKFDILSTRTDTNPVRFM